MTAETPKTNVMTTLAQKTPAHLPFVSIIFVSYNRPHDLIPAVRAALAQAYPNFEVIVWDNQSAKSETIRQLLKEFPEVRLHSSPQNLGFAVGMNRALELAQGEYCFLLCDDVVLDPNCTREMAKTLQSHAHIGITTGSLCLRPESWCRGGYDRQVAPDWLIVPREECKADIEVDVAPGGFLMLRKQWLEDWGGFQENFYMYFEDVELSWRMRQTGGRILSVATALAEHIDKNISALHKDVELRKINNAMLTFVMRKSVATLIRTFFKYYLHVLFGLVRRGRPKEAGKLLMQFFQKLPGAIRERRNFQKKMKSGKI